jgi:hypothetical protein
MEIFYMNNLTIFDIIAGTASILALLLTLIGYGLKLRRTFRQKREKAEQEFEQELVRLRIAGSTVSARTDLGFFVLIELGSLYDSIAFYRHHRTVSLVSSTFLMTLCVSISPISNKLLLIGFLLLCIVITGYCLIIHILVMRLEKYTESYEHRVKEVWQQPINKRVPSKQD